MKLDAPHYLLSPWTAGACVVGSVVFVAWRARRWWKSALDFQIAVAGDE